MHAGRSDGEVTFQLLVIRSSTLTKLERDGFNNSILCIGTKRVYQRGTSKFLKEEIFSYNNSGTIELYTQKKRAKTSTTMHKGDSLETETRYKWEREKREKMQTTTDRPLPFLYTNACSTEPEKENHDGKTKGKIEKFNAFQNRQKKQDRSPLIHIFLLHLPCMPSTPPR